MFVNAIMYYKVANATHAVANVDDYSGSARLLAATTLRNVLGTKNLGDILSEREIIANEMQELEPSTKFREIVHNIRIWPNLGAFQKEECPSKGLALSKYCVQFREISLTALAGTLGRSHGSLGRQR